ncbi:MAG: aminotransferase class III-fold pyridoxal phosphate-dependent enzyme [Desulfobacterales bacterium]|jgi:adenosylmethionine-8-amino-7-oxononanoate aminotransferase
MNILEESRNYLFYQHKGTLPNIQKTDGIYMWDQSGKEYIDGCSGAVVCNIGYKNSLIKEAIIHQAQNTFFAYRMHFENEPAIKLAKEMVAHSAPHLKRIFYVSGGSEAVETAMKLCRQYFYDRKEGSRHLFIGRVPAYHGCTLGALALTSYAPLETPFRPLIKTYPKIPAPYCYRCAYNLTYPDCGLACAQALEKTILEQGPQNVAGFIAEPIGGASTGALVPPEGYFDIIQSTCRKYSVMLILDEVMTGFGRTGKMFAYEHWNVEADILALSKGMASGYFPLGAILARDTLVDTVLNSGGFKHGYTYAGNPMACAVGLQVFKYIMEHDLCTNAHLMGTRLKDGLEGMARKTPIIGQVRGKGLLLAVELVQGPGTKEPFPVDANAGQLLYDIAFEQGLIIYPRRPINGIVGDHVLIAPPLIISAAEVDEILRRFEAALNLLPMRLTDSKGKT